MLGYKNFKLSTLHSTVIFVKYREVSTRTIIPNFKRCIRVLAAVVSPQHRRRRRCRRGGKEEASTSRCKGGVVLVSPRQPKWPLRTAIGVRYNYYVQLV